jgi:hypothetical protein
VDVKLIYHAWEELGLRMFENKMAMRMFGAKTEK